MTLKFEAGKSYRNPGNNGVVFECVWANDTHCCFSYVTKPYMDQPSQQFVTAGPHDQWRHFQEIRPRIKHTGWVNVYSDRASSFQKDKETADRIAAPDRIACVKIEIDCEEGEGL